MYIQIAKAHLASDSRFSFSHNYPFKGGHITRSFGRPKERFHALQLEMIQSVYMDEERCEFSPERAKRIQPLLRNLFLALANEIEKL